MKSADNNRNYNADVLRIIACIGVLVLHVLGTKGSIINTLLYYLGTISIPIFFILSGHFILNKKDLNMKYLLKKISNIIVLVLSLSIVYFILSLYKRGLNLNLLYEIFFGTIIQRGKLNLLWFLWALSLMYIISLPLKKKST